MSDLLGQTIAQVRERVTPSAEERDRLEETVLTLVDRTEAVVDELGVDADVLRVGSTARDTWLRGDRDIDIFVRFDPSYTREELERYGLEIGQTVLPDGRLEYAEHPYVSAAFEGYAVDLVPCFRVGSAAEIRSAVDRTPFHAAYVTERLDADLANDVRVLKRFFEAIGIYGSDLRTQGFSGYLTELLVLTYGDVRGVLEATATWQPPVRLDPEEHGETTFDDPLVVIDPTDPSRNVAAVVTGENVARLQHHARDLLENPDPDRFALEKPDALTEAELLAHLERRATTPIAIRFPTPDIVNDQLYPQLRRSIEGITRALEERGFEVVRADAFAGESAVLFVELSVAQRPRIERHEGPPVHVREHATSFLETYEDAEVYGPFIDGDRYVVERERDVRTAAAFLRGEDLLDVGLGADVRRILAEDYTVLVNEDITDLLPAFGDALARFYEPSP